jgi:DNA-binding transcriptional LysR family regulator
MNRLKTMAFENFQRRYPNVELVIEKHTYCKLTAKLLDGSLDIIFSNAEELKNQPSIQYCYAFNNPLVVLLSSTHPVALYAKTINDFPEMDVYVMDKEASMATETIIKRLVDGKNWKWNIKPYPNYESILLAVERNLGCAVTCLSSDACDSSKIKYYLTGDVLQVVCAWNANAYNEVVQAFISIINFTLNQ